jgi:DNA gyrase subunit B/topoisomerase-4 subunit B
MRPLIDHGHVFIAQPPLFKIELGKQVHWALSDAERDRVLANANGKQAIVQRFKGLGEMNPPTLKQTTLDPSQRTLLRVAIANEQAAEQTIQTLMGKDVEPRFKLIMERAPKLEDQDVDV